MRKKFIFISIFIVLAAAVGIGSSFLLLRSKALAPVVAVTDNLFGWKYTAGEYPVAAFPMTGDRLAYSDIRDPGGIPQGLPVRIKIPIIKVDSAIEDAYITPEGRMDVPAGSVNVAWFALGPPPGEVGSSVIGGHFGIRNGVPFVFYDLDKLKVGDKIFIINDEDETLQFVVRAIKLFGRTDDATEVFTSKDGKAHLNLITCEGVWNEVNGFYPERRVVFTDLTPLSVATTYESTFQRVLTIGSKGVDVSVLQGVLEEKGFLTLPAGTQKGSFDKTTSDALARYQQSIGLPPVGTFGPMTRTKLIAEVASTSIPNAGEPSDAPDLATGSAPITPEGPDSIETPSGMIASERIVGSIKNLFSTPLDALVTSFLLIAIVFMMLRVVPVERMLRSLVLGKKNITKKGNDSHV